MGVADFMMRPIILAGTLAMLTACASSSGNEGIGHIDLIGVSIIKYDDAPNNSEVRMPMPNHKVFLISFASDKDLAASTDNHQLDFHSVISICPIDQSREFYHSANLFYQGMQSLNGANGAAQNKYVYEVWFDYRALARRNAVFGKPDIPSYDLSKDPEDICIALNKSGWRTEQEFVTNTIVVPKALVSEALSVGLH